VSGKTGARIVTLSHAAVELITAQANGKLPTAPLFVDSFGNRWNKDSWKLAVPSGSAGSSATRRRGDLHPSPRGH
jgi:hypothetical protein